MGKYRAGAVSGISFALACFAFLAGGPWSRVREEAAGYAAAAVLGGLIAFIAGAIMHGRRGGPSGASRALGSMAFGWAVAIAGVILAWIALYVLVSVLFSISSSPYGVP